MSQQTKQVYSYIRFIGALSIFLSSTLVIAETQIDADIWADNWFALYVDEELVQEDSVPFNTERSFNTDSFSFSAELPAQGAMIIKDFYEDDSGLEYIGGRRQQAGDGGLAVQLRDTESGELIEVTSTDWQCSVIHQAPLNLDCASSDDPISECQSLIQDEPAGWMSADFDDGDWQPAINHGARAIRPHGGYSDVTWDPSVQLIWSEDLEIDNVVLCRFTIGES